MSQSDSLFNIAAQYEATLNLIDVVFPLELCLHHQILPLELNNDLLVVGMVDPQDKETIQYLTPIINSFGYSFHIQYINAQTHQLILAAYLKLAPKNTVSSNSERTSIAVTPSQNAPTLFEIPKEVAATSSQNAPTLFEIPKEVAATSPEQSIYERTTFIVENEEKTDKMQSRYRECEATRSIEPSPRSEIFFSEPQINQIESNNNISDTKPILDKSLVLNFSSAHLDRPTEHLKKLPPEILWEELLARILTEGIGRLYLQKHNRYGRIICSNNGVVQFSLDNVALNLFEGVIKEIKKMAKMPLTLLEKNKKLAIHKYYNYERILLRIEFFISKFGEEITIQVLRGQALKFYEQRQADKTIEQAIYLSQKLEKSLKKIRQCQSAADVVDLSSLKAIMRQVEKQFDLLDS